jgi:hypothetical protein
MKTTLRIKRGLKASLSAVDATKIGELSYCTDTHELFINNGSAYALLNDFSQYYDKTGINALLSALVSKSDVNNDYATEIDYSIVGDTIQVKQYYKNISTGATKEVSKTIPLASTTNAGLMAKEDTIALAKAISDISALNNKVMRYPVKLSSTNPSQTELNSTFISASGKAITDILDGTTMIDYDNGFLAYTYFSFSQPNHWLARGVDTVTIGTNTAPGIVQGSEDIGKIYIETDSTMSLVGFDSLSTQVDNNTTKLESIEGNAQVNVLESISVNGALQTIANKGVNLSVPTLPSDIGAVPTSLTINNKALSSNISLNASDVGAVPTSDLQPINESLAILKEVNNYDNGTLPITTNWIKIGSFIFPSSDLTIGARSITITSLYNGIVGTLTLKPLYASNYSTLTATFLTIGESACSFGYTGTVSSNQTITLYAQLANTTDKLYLAPMATNQLTFTKAIATNVSPTNPFMIDNTNQQEILESIKPLLNWSSKGTYGDVYFRIGKAQIGNTFPTNTRLNFEFHMADESGSYSSALSGIVDMCWRVVSSGNASVENNDASHTKVVTEPANYPGINIYEINDDARLRYITNNDKFPFSFGVVPPTNGWIAGAFVEIWCHCASTWRSLVINNKWSYGRNYFNIETATITSTRPANYVEWNKWNVVTTAVKTN